MPRVGGHEHDSRGTAPGRLHDLEAADAGHAHVEEQQLGRGGPDCHQRGAAIRAAADHLDLGILGKHPAQRRASGRFVVDDQHADGGVHWRIEPPDAARNGMTTFATVPRASLESASWCRSP